MRLAIKQRALALALVTAGGLLLPGVAAADPINAGSLWNWTLLALNGGTISINEAYSITGNVGISSGVTTLAAQKAPNGGAFTGATYVYGGSATTSFANTWADKNYDPSGGVLSGGAAPCDPKNSGGITCGVAMVNPALDQANLDATLDPLNNSLEDQFNALFSGGGATTLDGVNSYTSPTYAGGTHLYDVQWNYSGDVLTLNGTADDWFIFRSSGSGGTWAASQMVLNGVDPNHVWFYFTGGTTGELDFTVNKAETVFQANIFDPTGQIIYHNPATFDGRIIAHDVMIHSNAIISAPDPPTTTVPEPATMLLLGTGLIGLGGIARRRRSRKEQSK